MDATEPQLLPAEQIANALLPGVNPYIVLASSDPPQSIRLPSAIGATSRTLDAALADWLRERGVWRGRAPAIFIDDEMIRDIAATKAADEAIGFRLLHDEIMAAVVCHEAAHVAESEPDLSSLTTERRDYGLLIAAYSIATVDNLTLPPFFGHSAHFIRNAIHLHHRAQRLGWMFPEDMLFQGEQYGVADPSHFAYALDQEPANLESVSIFDVRSFRAPTNFSRLWEHCVQLWIESNSSNPRGVEVAQQLLEINYEG